MISEVNTYAITLNDTVQVSRGGKRQLSMVWEAPLDISLRGCLLLPYFLVMQTIFFPLQSDLPTPLKGQLLKVTLVSVYRETPRWNYILTVTCSRIMTLIFAKKRKDSNKAMSRAATCTKCLCGPLWLQAAVMSLKHFLLQPIVSPILSEFEPITSCLENGLVWCLRL